MAILHGSERFLILAATEQIRTQAKASFGEITTSFFDGASTPPADILDECRSLNLMMTHKLVIVDNAELLLKSNDDEDAPAARRGQRSARELFESYAEAPEPSATLVLRAGAWRPGRLDKAVIASKGHVEKFEPLSEPDAANWAIDRAARAHKAKLETDAARRLIEATGPDLARIDAELEKLSLYSPGQPITAATVALLSPTTREEDFWEIQPSLLAGDPPRALAHLRDLLDISGHDPTPLFFTYFDLARKLHAASRGLAARENPRSLMGRLRLWGPSGEALLSRAASVKPEHAAKLMQSIITGITRARTGRGDSERVLEALTLEFASLGTR